MAAKSMQCSLQAASEHMRTVSVMAMKFTLVDGPQPVDAHLPQLMPDMLNHIQDEDRYAYACLLLCASHRDQCPCHAVDGSSLEIRFVIRYRSLQNGILRVNSKKFVQGSKGMLATVADANRPCCSCLTCVLLGMQLMLPSVRLRTRNFTGVRSFLSS